MGCGRSGAKSPVRWGSRWPGPDGVEEHLQWCHWAQRFTLWQEKILEDRPVRIFNPGGFLEPEMGQGVRCHLGVSFSFLGFHRVSDAEGLPEGWCAQNNWALYCSTHEYINNANEMKAKHLFDSGLSETQSSRDEETTRVKAMSCQRVCGVWRAWLMGGGERDDPRVQARQQRWGWKMLLLMS